MPKIPARAAASRKASRYHCLNRKNRLTRKYITVYRASRKKPEYRPSLPQKDSYTYSEVSVEIRAMMINTRSPFSPVVNSFFSPVCRIPAENSLISSP